MECSQHCDVFTEWTRITSRMTMTCAIIQGLLYSDKLTTMFVDWTGPPRAPTSARNGDESPWISCKHSKRVCQLGWLLLQPQEVALRDSNGPRSLFVAGAAVAERLARSPPTQANRARSMAGPPDSGNRAGRCRWAAGFFFLSGISRFLGHLIPATLRNGKPDAFFISSSPPRRSAFNTRPGLFGFSHVGIVPDDAAGRRDFSVISHFPHPFTPGGSILTSITLIGSDDLDIKSHPNLFTNSPIHSLRCHRKELHLSGVEMSSTRRDVYPALPPQTPRQVGQTSGFGVGSTELAPTVRRSTSLIRTRVARHRWRDDGDDDFVARFLAAMLGDCGNRFLGCSCTNRFVQVGQLTFSSWVVLPECGRFILLGITQNVRGVSNQNLPQGTEVLAGKLCISEH
ncbi:hypothetical protein PR048_021205 [Dryococelus australis]|uniref:Uncharacterized protein n=1 Tax=Dryococelus australis TaxID=614101 RepID=A0ABQ9GXN9_9NEOP|nr:hypothetical protein PR048_021205 [Dryococelus australis]